MVVPAVASARAPGRGGLGVLPGPLKRVGVSRVQRRVTRERARGQNGFHDGEPPSRPGIDIPADDYRVSCMRQVYQDLRRAGRLKSGGRLPSDLPNIQLIVLF